jgi:hypothetical protein
MLRVPAGVGYEAVLSRLSPRASTGSRSGLREFVMRDVDGNVDRMRVDLDHLPELLRVLDTTADPMRHPQPTTFSPDTRRADVALEQGPSPAPEASSPGRMPFGNENPFAQEQNPDTGHRPAAAVNGADVTGTEAGTGPREVLDLRDGALPDDPDALVATDGASADGYLSTAPDRRSSGGNRS